MAAPEFPPASENIVELLSADAIATRVGELGAQITEDYRDRGENLVLLAVLKGSVLFLADLARAIRLPAAMDFIGIASYGDESASSGVVMITSDLTRPITRPVAHNDG